jgi:hypothetical protein
MTLTQHVITMFTGLVDGLSDDALDALRRDLECDIAEGESVGINTRILETVEAEIAWRFGVATGQLDEPVS